jgi:hypothetical protein
LGKIQHFNGYLGSLGNVATKTINLKNILKTISKGNKRPTFLFDFILQISLLSICFRNFYLRWQKIHHFTGYLGSLGNVLAKTIYGTFEKYPESYLSFFHFDIFLKFHCYQLS